MNILFIVSISLSFLFLILFFITILFLRALIPFLFWGALYAPTKEEKVKKMIELLNIKKGEKALDIGAGDGRLVIALASAGALATGFEISPFLVKLAQKNIKKAGLEGKAFVYRKNFWKEDFSQYDAVTVYGIGYIMKSLEKKLKKELKQEARIVSNNFHFPTWEPIKKENNIFLYKKV
ncbi:MAG: methyltransferase domain-containing protein [Candidatus Nealsonbacteria bacterium]|nr:methyltransferase domain-containing protein [Candidatus Nealsonbacteria bacterium]